MSKNSELNKTEDLKKKKRRSQKLFKLGPDISEMLKGELTPKSVSKKRKKQEITNENTSNHGIFTPPIRSSKNNMTSSLNLSPIQE